MTKQEFSQITKQFREERHFTQEEAATRLGVPVRTLQNWEIARNMPKGFGLQAILKAFKAPVPARKTRPRAGKENDSPALSTFGGNLETHLL